MKKGFVFIETIITVVILSTSLIYLYGSYSSIINNEEARVYYDDPSYIYKTSYIRDFLLDYSDIEMVKATASDNLYSVDISPNYDGLFDSDSRNDFAYIWSNFNVYQMLIISQDLISECNGSDNDSDICKRTYDNLSYNMRNYIRSLNDTSQDYFLIVEYSEKIDNQTGKIRSCVLGRDTYCHSYYASLGI